MAPVGIALSAVVFFLTLGLAKVQMLHKARPASAGSEGEESAEPVPKDQRRLLGVLGLQIVLVLLAVVFLDYAIGKQVFVAVSMVSFFIPLLIAGFSGKIGAFRRGMENYFRITLPAMANEFMLFTCVGFFGFALGQQILAIP